MATKKAPKKFTEKKDTKSEEQLLIQATINSSYSLLIPCVNGDFVYVRNPLTGKVKHFETNKPEFLSFIKELTNIGFGEKLNKDFNELVDKNSEHWTKVVKFLKEQKAFEVIQ